MVNISKLSPKMKENLEVYKDEIQNYLFIDFDKYIRILFDDDCDDLRRYPNKNEFVLNKLIKHYERVLKTGEEPYCGYDHRKSQRFVQKEVFFGYMRYLIYERKEDWIHDSLYSYYSTGDYDIFSENGVKVIDGRTPLCMIGVGRRTNVMEEVAFIPGESWIKSLVNKLVEFDLDPTDKDREWLKPLAEMVVNGEIAIEDDKIIEKFKEIYLARKIIENM